MKGGNPSSRLDRALQEPGGLAAFVQKGQTVVIKPNIGRAQEPRIAATTNPELVKRLVEQCLQASMVVVSGDKSSSYKSVIIPGAVKLKKTMVHELIL